MRDWFLVFDAFWMAFVATGFIYTMIAAYRTHEDRLRILMCVLHRPASGPTVLKEYEAVSFTRHFLARLRLRNPLVLYGALIHDAIDNPRTEVVQVGTILAGRVAPGDDDDDDGKPTIN